MLRLSSTLRLDDCMSEKEREKKEKKKKTPTKCREKTKTSNTENYTRVVVTHFALIAWSQQRTNTSNKL